MVGVSVQGCDVHVWTGRGPPLDLEFPQHTENTRLLTTVATNEETQGKHLLLEGARPPYSTASNKKSKTQGSAMSFLAGQDGFGKLGPLSSILDVFYNISFLL